MDAKQATGYRTPLGLKIAGVTQVFAWERSIQHRFARFAARNAKLLVNVGYGLGFSQQVFGRTSNTELHLIEMNLSIMNEARARNLSGHPQIHLGSWQEKLPTLLADDATIYFDAFPVDRTFDYTERSFRIYLSPLLKLLSHSSFSTCFFVAFDSVPIRFNQANLQIRREIALPIGKRSNWPHIRHASLYSVKIKRRAIAIND